MIYGTCMIDCLCQCHTRGVSVKSGFDQKRMRVVQKWLIMYVSENLKISVLWISALFRSIFHVTKSTEKPDLDYNTREPSGIFFCILGRNTWLRRDVSSFLQFISEPLIQNLFCELRIIMILQQFVDVNRHFC